MGVVYTLDKAVLDTPRIAADRAVFVPFKAETIKPVIDPGAPAIERCLAAKALPLVWLRVFYGRSMAYGMKLVARRLCPKLVSRARETRGISLRLLVHAAHGRTPEEQARRWDDYILRAIEKSRPARRARREHSQANEGDEERAAQATHHDDEGD